VAEAEAADAARPRSTSSVQKARSQGAQEPSAAEDVVPQGLTALEQHSGGEPAGVRTVDSPALADEEAKPEDRDGSAPVAREVPKDEAKKGGIISSGFSMLPTISGVGSFFGLGKRDAKQVDATDATGTTEDAQLDREAPPVQVPPSLFPSAGALGQPQAEAEQQQQGSSERISGEGPLQGSQGPVSHDKSVGDTTNGALDTAISVPEVPTPNLILTDASVQQVPEFEAIRQLDFDPSSHKPEHEHAEKDDLAASTVAEEDSAKAANDQDNIAPAPATDSMDWAQEPSSGKKAKKGKNKRQSTKDEPVAALVSEAEVIPASEVVAAEEDPWADTTSGKKGKKAKKDKRKKGTFSLDEPDPPVVESVDAKEEPAVEDAPEPATLETPLETAPPEVAEPAVETAPKSAALETSLETAPPEAAEPAPAEEAPEDFWAPKISKKGKKGEKKGQIAKDANDVAPASISPETSILVLTERPQEIVKDSEPQPVSQELEPAPEADTAFAAVELSIDDAWPEPITKKGKKDKKKKKQQSVQETFAEQSSESVEPAAQQLGISAEDLELVAQQLEVSTQASNTVEGAEPELPAVSAEDPVVPESTPEGPLPEDGPTDFIVAEDEPVQEEVWPETSGGKKGKKAKKKKQSTKDAISIVPDSTPTADTLQVEDLSGPSQVGETVESEQPSQDQVEVDLQQAEPSQAEQPPPDEPAQEDAWAASISKKGKGKKDKKKKKAATWEEPESVTPEEAPEAFAEKATTEEPASAEHPLVEAAEEQSQRDAAGEPETPLPDESVAAAQSTSSQDGPSQDTPSQAESTQDNIWPEPTPSGKKGKKSKKRKDAAEPSPWILEIVEEPAGLKTEEPSIPSDPASDTHAEEVARMPEPEPVVEAEPEVVMTAKKSKKDKKKKKGSKSM